MDIDLDFELVETPLQFHLHGVGTTVKDDNYGQAGVALMNQMWDIIKKAGLRTTGTNHWVYSTDDEFFTGVVLIDDGITVPTQLESMTVNLRRHVKHLHVGPYRELGNAWRRLKSAVRARGEIPMLPSLEVYGHSCEDADESTAETTILLAVQAR